MIRFISLALCLMLGTTIYSQNTSVVSIGGGTINSEILSLDQTIGELVVSDINDANVTIQQGFQNTFLKMGIVVNARIFLQGPYNENLLLMNDDLRNLNYVPEKSPYLDSAMITDLNVLTVTGNDAVVDWVFVEIRDRSANDNVVAYQSGLLQRDGDIVGIDGVTPLRFDLLPGTYYFSIDHRNHLGIITNTAQLLSGSSASFDFTTGSVVTLGGVNAQWTMLSGDFALIAGDANVNNKVRFSGADNDANPIKDFVLSDPLNFFNSVTFASTGYLLSDVDLNGFGKFSGSNNDTNLIKDNVLGYPANFFGSVTYSISGFIPE